MTLFFKKLFYQILLLTIKFLYNIITIFIIGLICRYVCHILSDVNAFKDYLYLYLIFISYWVYISNFAPAIRVIAQLLMGDIIMTMNANPNNAVSGGGQSSGGQSSSSLGRFTPLSVYQPSSGAEGRFTPPRQPQGRCQSVPISDQLNSFCEPLTPTEQDVNPNPELNRDIEKENMITMYVAERMYGSLLDKKRQIRDLEDN